MNVFSIQQLLPFGKRVYRTADVTFEWNTLSYGYGCFKRVITPARWRNEDDSALGRPGTCSSGGSFISTNVTP
jgi:hypothetical protein